MNAMAFPEPSFEHRREVELPEGWAYAPLGSLGSWGTGNTPSKGNAAFWSGGKLPWVSPKDMKTAYLDDAIDHITERAVVEGRAAVVPPGTIFFVVRGMILAHTFPAAITMKRAAFNQDMRSLVPLDGLHGPYVLRALHREAPAILGAVREATHGTLRLESETLQPWPIPIAPSAEQRRIVEKVEALLEQVNRAKERLDRVPLILKRFRQAVLAAARSGELTRGWRDGDSDDWPTQPLKNHPIHVRIGPFGSLLHRSDYVDGGVPLLNPMHIRDGQLWPDPEYAVSAEKANELSAYVLRCGDVVLGRRGEMGRAAVVRPEHEGMLCGTGSMFLRPDTSRWLPEFLSICLRSPQSVASLEEASVGSTMTNLNQAAMAHLQLPLAPLDEQAEIVRQVEKLFALADAIQRRVQAATGRADGLPQAILSKAFSGELVPTEAELARGEGRTYETAEELLRRVQRDAASATTTPTRRRRVGGARGR